MSALGDLRHAPRLDALNVNSETDLVPVYHPTGGTNPEWAASLADLKAASGGGSGANTFFYKADTKTYGISDPGTGKMRWNHEDQHQATTLVLDWLTADGFDPVLLFQTFEVGATFIIQQSDFSLNHQIWRKTAQAENMPDFFQVPVQFVAAGPAGPGIMPFNKTVAILLQISTTMRMPNLPTSDRGLPPGSLWNNKGVLNIVC